MEEPCSVLVEIKYKNEKGEIIPIRSSNKTAIFIDNPNAKDNQNKFNGPLINTYITSKTSEIQQFIE